MMQEYEHSQGPQEMLWGATGAMGHDKKTYHTIGRLKG
jgi:hypothetical protein